MGHGAGRDVGGGTARVGTGVHPRADPAPTDDFVQVPLPICVREFHTCAAEGTPERMSFLVDDEVVRVVQQSPAYPMQVMRDIDAFPGDGGAPPPGPWPKELAVDSFRRRRSVAG